MVANENKLIVILGPTASGKTRLAAMIAHDFNGEVISADSRQVYRDMNLGTGKDYSDYIVNEEQVPYHLVDIRNPGEKYNVFEFQNDFFRVYPSIVQRGKLPVLCGGTGMYIEAITRGYKLIHVPVNQSLREDLEMKSHEELILQLAAMKPLHNVTDADTRKRTIRAIEIEKYYQDHPEINPNLPKLDVLFIGTQYSRDRERKNITDRLRIRLKAGMIDEVRNLFNKGLSFDDIIYYGLEYKFIAKHLVGELSFDEMFNKLNTAIHQFAKRQRTWFRKMEREGARIYWINGELPLQEKVAGAAGLIHKFLEH